VRAASNFKGAGNRPDTGWERREPAERIHIDYVYVRAQNRDFKLRTKVPAR